MTTKKYRPYFTLAELKHLHQCILALRDKPPPTQYLSKYLNKYIRDIEEGYQQPNHTLKPNIEERLGFGASISEDEIAKAEAALDKLVQEKE